MSIINNHVQDYNPRKDGEEANQELDKMKKNQLKQNRLKASAIQKSNPAPPNAIEMAHEVFNRVGTQIAFFFNPKSHPEFD